MNQTYVKGLFWHRFKLLALVAVFFAPFVGGWFAFYVFEVRPAAGNYGTLVQPVKKISWPLLEDRNGRRYDQGFGRKWTFLLFTSEGCSEQCYSNLYYMRQIRTLLGRDTLRLQNVLVSARPADDKLAVFLREYPNLIVVDNESAGDLFLQFEVEGTGAVGASPRLYLVDPDANLMMFYPPEPDQNRVLEDIKKLMKVSQIG